MALVEISTPADMLEEPAPAPCGDLSVEELIDWLYCPQYTNGFLDFESANHMKAAAALIEKLIGKKI